MTEDELDLLASAYLDGEATSEEVAMVEADPELLARVEELRPITGLMATPIPPPQAIKEQHLAAAMAAFDNRATEDTAERQQTSQRQDNVTSIAFWRRSRTRDRSPARPRTMPQWLPAAAALLLVGGGVIWLAGQTGGDDSETASFDTGAESESADAVDDSAEADAARAASAGADESAESFAAEVEEEAVEESADAAMADEETTDDATEAAGDGSDADEGAADQPTTTTVPATSGGFFPWDPVLSFDEVPGPDELGVSDLPDLRTDLSRSRCGSDFEPDTGSELAGYLPVEIAGEAAELLVVVDADGAGSIVFVGDDCEPLTP